jgi:hypothetical protein
VKYTDNSDQGNGTEGTIPIDHDEGGTTHVLYFLGKNPYLFLSKTNVVFIVSCHTQTFFHAFIVKSFKFVDISFPSFK